ncbi:hypothetical protein SAMN04489798_2170 [Pseudomonas arsenicoxydans]|uniref:Uncharacterized protein n=2 Tax=Pseudomonas arsenicoxydans TaxID=702115 RepID=A0A1H0H7Y3_9PSED|nr:hypothetical protein SAMN04489798_2170 [Pseudomonas arsenicoxydans]
MNPPRHFEIRYRFNNTQHVFVQPDSHMTDADAWYYACLHAGVGLLYEMDCDQHNHETLREHAQGAGLTQVRWKGLQ